MRKKFIGILCIFAAAVLAAVLVFKYLSIFYDYENSKELYSDLQNKYTEENNADQPTLDALLTGIEHRNKEFDPIDVDSEKLQDQNPDYIGWIYVPKTDISYPVVASADNSDYLHADFNRAYSFPGTIFMDCQDTKGILNHHTILYGHNMNNGTMFAQIKSYRDQEFADEHPVFWFITPKYKLLYQVFSVCSPSPFDRQQYGIDGIDYKSNAEFNTAIEQMKKSSVIQSDKEVLDTDYIMSLSTCTGNSSVRCIVHGVLLGALEE